MMISVRLSTTGECILAMEKDMHDVNSICIAMEIFGSSIAKRQN
jgi:hypothetical protein